MWRTNAMGKWERGTSPGSCGIEVIRATTGRKGQAGDVEVPHCLGAAVPRERQKKGRRRRGAARTHADAATDRFGVCS